MRPIYLIRTNYNDAFVHFGIPNLLTESGQTKDRQRNQIAADLPRHISFSDTVSFQMIEERWQDATEQEGFVYLQGNMTGAYFTTMIYKQHVIPTLAADKQFREAASRVNSDSDPINHVSSSEAAVRFGYIDDQDRVCGFSLSYNRFLPGQWVVCIIRNTNLPLEQQHISIYLHGITFPGQETAFWSTKEDLLRTLNYQQLATLVGRLIPSLDMAVDELWAGRLTAPQLQNGFQYTPSQATILHDFAAWCRYTRQPTPYKQVQLTTSDYAARLERLQRRRPKHEREVITAWISRELHLIEAAKMEPRKRTLLRRIAITENNVAMLAELEVTLDHVLEPGLPVVVPHCAHQAVMNQLWTEAQAASHTPEERLRIAIYLNQADEAVRLKRQVKGKKPFTGKDSDHTPLTLAASLNHAECAKELARLSSTPEKNSAILHAARTGAIEAAKALHRAKADITTQEVTKQEGHNNILFIAAKFNQAEFIVFLRVLLNGSANFNTIFSKESIHKAFVSAIKASPVHVEVAEVLMELGCNAKAKVQDDLIALEYVLRTHFHQPNSLNAQQAKALVELLLKAGAHLASNPLRSHLASSVFHDTLLDHGIMPDLMRGVSASERLTRCQEILEIIQVVKDNASRFKLLQANATTLNKKLEQAQLLDPKFFAERIKLENDDPSNTTNWQEYPITRKALDSDNKLTRKPHSESRSFGTQSRGD